VGKKARKLTTGVIRTGQYKGRDWVSGDRKRTASGKSLKNLAEGRNERGDDSKDGGGQVAQGEK